MAQNEKTKVEQDAHDLGLYLAVVKQECIDNYFDFFVEFWDTVSSDELIINWHIKAICDKLQEHVKRVINKEKSIDLILNIPPGMSKSTMVSVLLQPWIWLHFPQCVVISSSYSGDLAVDHSLKSKACFKSDRYQMYFQEHFKAKFKKNIYLVKDNENNWVNNFFGARITTSTGGTITGKHGHIILRDDPINPEQAESTAYREKANRFNDRTLSNRKKDKELVPTITVMQRLHTDDSTGHDLRKTKKSIEHVCLPAESTDEVKPESWKKFYKDGLLDPIRLNKEILIEQEEDLGAFGYSGQYRQQPTPPEGGVIKGAGFVYMNESEVPFNPSEVPMKFMIDGAFTDKTSNDPSALMAYRHYGGKNYIYNCITVNYNLDKFLPFVEGWLMANQYTTASLIKIELKASGHSIMSMLRSPEHGSFNCSNINNVHVGWGKYTRAEYTSPSVASGKVVLINGGWVDKFVYECITFPNDTHDDKLDLLCYSTLEEMKTIKGRVYKTSLNLKGKRII